MKKSDSMDFVKYESPQISLLSVCVERGFEASTTLEDMYETEGSWD